MILIEAVTFLLSLVSSYTSDPPESANQNTSENRTVLINATEVDYTYGHDCAETSSTISPLERENELRDYGTCNEHRINSRPVRFYLKLLRGSWVSLSIILTVLPTGILSVLILYLELNTVNVCFEYKNRNYSLPRNVTIWKALSGAVQAVLVHMWFPASLMFLFGWKKYKSNYLTTAHVSIATGILLLVVELVLLVFGVYEKSLTLIKYVDNGLFFVGVLYNSCFVASRIHRSDPLISYSKLRIMTIISIQFFFGLLVVLVYSEGIVPWYKKTAKEIEKAMIAASTPALAVIPLVICKMFAMQSSTLVDPGRRFILVYFLEGLPEAIYKIMQSNVEHMWVFICLSVLHGLGCLFLVVTKNLRYFLWKQLVRCLKNTCPCCSSSYGEAQNESPNQRRLKADLEIQRILFKYSSLILMQAYFALFVITNYETPAWDVLREVLIRIPIGFVIELFFNVLTVTLQMHWHDIPISEVWFKHWRLHVLANSLAAAMTVLYFTQFLLNVVRDHAHSHHGVMVNVQNCTAPFAN